MKNLKTITTEELEASSKKLLEAYEATIKVAEAAIQKRNAAQAKYRKVQIELESRTELTLESALVARIASGENTRGYNWLQEKSWKGDWHKTGLRHDGSQWSDTNQYVMTVWSDYRWGEAELKVQAEKILEIIDVIKSGQFKPGTKIKLSKDEEIDLHDCKVFDIFDRGCGESYNWNLAYISEDRWTIFDSYSCKPWRTATARLTGTLQECLEEMRAYLYYEGGNDNGYDEDED